jgi:hypothetical protein
MKQTDCRLRTKRTSQEKSEMSKIPKLPDAENVPALTINIEGLVRHSLLMAFFPTPELSTDELKLRSWLLHTATTAARHYSKSRELVVAQNSADQVRDGGAIFYIFDVYEQLEGAIMATYRACAAIRRLNDTNSEAMQFSTAQAQSLEKLAKLRNQFEHMHQQITTKETGNGPILISFDDEGGKAIRFRSLSLETAALHALIEGIYKVVASMYPSFNANTPPETTGPAKLTMSFTIG